MASLSDGRRARFALPLGAAAALIFAAILVATSVAIIGVNHLQLTRVAERAARELRAAGDAPAVRRAAAWERLTSQELQIATLAAQGLTNREIGARLLLSHRTVSTHLYHTFPKLGISNRAQLPLVLADLIDDTAEYRPAGSQDGGD